MFVDRRGFAGLRFGIRTGRTTRNGGPEQRPGRVFATRAGGGDIKDRHAPDPSDAAECYSCDVRSRAAEIGDAKKRFRVADGLGRGAGACNPSVPS
jgi:hypothetical protein